MQTRYIVTLLILCAGLALASDQVGAAKKATPKPPKSSLAVPVKPLTGNAYEAVLARPVPFKKVYKVAGLSWTCFKSNCTAHGAAVRPSPAQCRSLEKQAGKLKSCGRKGEKPGAVLTPGLIQKPAAAAPKPVKPGPAAPGKSAPGNAYEAMLVRPVPFKKVYKAAGLSWTCVKVLCTARGAADGPSKVQCQALEKRAGKLRACGPKGGTPKAALAPGLVRKSPGMVRKPGPAESKKPGPASSKKPSGQVNPGSIRRPGRAPRSGLVRAPDMPGRPGFIRTAPIVVTGAPDTPPPPDPHAIVGPDLTIRTEPITVTGSP